MFAVCVGAAPLGVLWRSKWVGESRECSMNAVVFMQRRSNVGFTVGDSSIGSVCASMCVRTMQCVWVTASMYAAIPSLWTVHTALDYMLMASS